MDLFTWASKALERATTMTPPQCRGTVRLALKQVGLEPKTLTVAGLVIVFEQIMPRELEVRGVKTYKAVCLQLLSELAEAELDDNEPTGPSKTDSILRRMFS